MSRPIVMKLITDIIPYTNNPRTHPPEQIDKLACAIAEFGWDQPIVVDKNNIIIKGHGRLEAAKKMNLKEVPVIVRDDLTPAQVKAARISDNILADYSTNDDEKLKLELEQLTEMDVDLSVIGLEDDYLASLTALERSLDHDDYSSPDASSPNAKAPANKEVDIDSYEFSHICPRCQFEFND